LSIGGSSYSENPAGRLLIVNGQVFHEGDQLTNELLLERIELKAAVLSFRGYRYRVTF
jgi:general secretion pathway protein B